jgi:signal transduction histidine kinase
VRSKFTYAIVIFIISLIVLVILSLNFQNRIADLLKSSDTVTRSQQIMMELHRLENYLKDAETGQRGYLLSRDTVFLQPYLRFRTQISPTSAKLQELTKGDLRVQNKLVRLRGFISRRMEMIQENLHDYGTDRESFIRNLNQGRMLMDSCRQLINEIHEMEMSALNEGQSQQLFFSVKAPENFRLLFIFSAIALVTSFGLILREIYQRNRYQKELQLKVVQLNRAYEELQQVTFVTSHDFQEPLRKIRIFSNRLMVSHKERMNNEGQLIVERINVAAGRIHELIEELSNFMNLTQSNEIITRIELAHLVRSVSNEMNEKLVLKNAHIDISLFVELEGYRSQLSMLFKALFDNSLKFARPDEPLLISVTGQLCVEKEQRTGFPPVQYYQITVKDNGLGFEQEFSRKIFQLFRRLHNNDNGPEGKGVGLALVERIMVNHQGYVTAQSRPNEGASFHLFFPVKS